MEPQIPLQDPVSNHVINNESKFTKLVAPLQQVTFLSKTLAAILFILLPFIGFYIGHKSNIVSLPEVDEFGIDHVDNKNYMPEDPSVYMIDPYMVSFEYPAGWHIEELDTEQEKTYTHDENLLRSVKVSKGDFDFIQFSIVKNQDVNLGLCAPYHASFVEGLSSYWVRDEKNSEDRCSPGDETIQDFKKIGSLLGYYVVEALAPRPISIALSKDYVLQIYIASKEYSPVNHPELIISEMPKDLQSILSSLTYNTVCSGNWCESSSSDAQGVFDLSYPKELNLDGRLLSNRLESWTAWDQGYGLPVMSADVHSYAILTKDRSTIFYMKHSENKVVLHKILLVDKSDTVLQTYADNELGDWVTDNGYGPIWPRYVGSSSVMMYYKSVSSEEKLHTILVTKDGKTKELSCGVMPGYIAVSDDEKNIAWSCPDKLTISDWEHDTEVGARVSELSFKNDRLYYGRTEQKIFADSNKTGDNNACATLPLYSMNYQAGDVKDESTTTPVYRCSTWWDNGDW